MTWAILVLVLVLAVVAVSNGRADNDPGVTIIGVLLLVGAVVGIGLFGRGEPLPGPVNDAISTIENGVTGEG